jgi:type IV pilus assembly protein PilE
VRRAGQAIGGNNKEIANRRVTVALPIAPLKEQRHEHCAPTPTPLLGFHLLEMLIVLVIIGILAALSVPTYTQYLIHARRFEAENTLVKLAIALEQFHFEHQTYENASLAALGFAEMIAGNHYQLKILSATPYDYELASIPISDWAKKDLLCATLMLNSQGEKSATGTGNIDECW